MLHQIAGRLGDASDKLSVIVRRLLTSLGEHHPHETGWTLFSLRHGATLPTSNRGAPLYVFKQDKIQAAKDILVEMRASHRALLEQMEHLIDAYIELAFHTAKPTMRDEEVHLTPKLRRLRDLPLVPVPTRDPPLPGEEVIYVKEYHPKWTYKGGISVPKLVQCKGSDGRTYRHFVKGQDDLRQDAVMQQLFRVTNRLLTSDKECRRRDLQMLTYKVVPLGPGAGLVEFVEGTLTLGQYLVAQGPQGNASAHARYDSVNWKRWPSSRCRDELMAAKDFTSQRRVFDEICQNFRPVLHYFFLENFASPADWLCKRLAFTRSVAASSMIGFIVGLGDRHTQNILLSQKTGEIVHIDFGIAFDQGRTQNKPELVPFRLTRDLVDAFGVGNTSGVFQRCCEETLRVLRTDADTILTVIEVLLHDPLARWTRQAKSDDLRGAVASPVPTSGLKRAASAMSLAASGRSETNSNLDAERAVLRVKEKLRGIEHGEFVSVQGQVKRLITEAQNPDNLCQLFPGWMPWV